MSPHLLWTPVSLWPYPCSGSHGPLGCGWRGGAALSLPAWPSLRVRRSRGHSWGTCRCPPALPRETRAALEERKSLRFMERAGPVSRQPPAAAASTASPSLDQNGQQCSPAGSLPGHFAEEERGFHTLFKSPMGGAEEWVTSHWSVLPSCFPSLLSTLDGYGQRCPVTEAHVDQQIFRLPFPEAVVAARGRL